MTSRCTPCTCWRCARTAALRAPTTAPSSGCCTWPSPWSWPTFWRTVVGPRPAGGSHDLGLDPGRGRYGAQRDHGRAHRRHRVGQERGRPAARGARGRRRRRGRAGPRGRRARHAGLAAVVAEFGPEVLARRRVAGPGRARPGRLRGRRLAALEAIVHPYVGRRSAELMGPPAPDRRGLRRAAAGRERPAGGYDVVVVVDAAGRRAAGPAGRPARDAGADARARMAAQATREERLAVADVVIDNDAV